MPTERTCETCVFQKRGHCTLTAVAWNTVDNQCLHWGPRPPTNTLSSGNGDWTQTTDLTHGGSSPAGDWREPMVDTSNSSTPSEAHVGNHLLTGGLKPEDVEPDPQAIMAERDLLKQRVAELSRDNWNLHEALSVAEAEMQPTETCPACKGDVPWGKSGICYLCGNMGVVTKERLLRIDAFRQCEAANKRVAELEGIAGDQADALIAMQYDLRQARCWSDAWKRAAKLERRAVEALAEHIETACDGFAHGGMSAMEVAPGGCTDAAEIAAWARNRARGESGE